MLLLLLFTTAAAEMSGKIVGGSNADIQDWPFITSLFIFKGSNTGGACGGSLISSQTILTAAHCVGDGTLEDAKRTLSDFSSALMGHANYNKATLARQLVDYVAHAGYDPTKNICDVAVVFLDKPVTFSETVKKVLLMKKINYKKDKKMMVAGWGAVSVGLSSSRSTLKSLPQTLMHFRECKMTFHNQGYICAAEINSPEFPYSGDSGGPIVKEGTFHQMGVVSFRATYYKPGAGLSSTTVYSAVPYYYEWIENTQNLLFNAHCTKQEDTSSSSESE